MHIPKRFVACATLIIIVATVLPLVFSFLLRPSADAEDNFLWALYATLPTGTGLAVAYLLAKGYFIHGQGSILTFGSAVLMWGLAGVASIIDSFVASTLGPTMTIGTVGLLLSSLLHLSGTLPAIDGLALRKTSSLRLRLAIAYSGVTVAVAVLSYFVRRFAPLFFGVDGRTPLAMSFTEVSIILLLASSIVFFMKTNKKPSSTFRYWYSIALALFALAQLPSIMGIFEAGFAEALATLTGDLSFLISALVYLTQNLQPQ
jgi:hypothetical protein